MAKDFKPRHAERKGSGLLLGMFIGFLLGLGVAAAIAIYIYKMPIPFVSKSVPAKSSEKGVPGDDKSAKGEDGKPRFDFYRILPGQEEPVTDKQLREAAKKLEAAKQDAAKVEAAKSEIAKPDVAKQEAAKAPAEEPPARDTYFIQAGAFQNPADADNRKAQLALLGLEASVEPTNVPEKGTWYRVRLGPYTRVEDINRVRGQLAQNNIDGSLVRVRDPNRKN